MDSPFSPKKILLAAGALAVVLAVIASPWIISAYYYSKGRAAIRSGDFSAARGFFQNSLKFNPRRAESWGYLGHVELGKPDPSGTSPAFPDAHWERAIAYYEKALSIGFWRASDQELAVTHLLGMAYWKTGQYAKADERFLAVIANPIHNRGYTFVARFYVARDYFDRFNKPEEALRILFPAPGDAQTQFTRSDLFHAYTLLARLYYFYGQYDRAKEFADLSIASKDAPGERDIQTAHIIAALVAARKKDMKTALVEHALALEGIHAAGNPDPNALKCTLARLYAESGDHAKAISIAGEKLAGKTKFAYTDSFFCIEVLVRSNSALRNETAARKYLRQYIDVTDTFAERNAIVMRDREEFAKLLAK